MSAFEFPKTPKPLARKSLIDRENLIPDIKIAMVTGVNPRTNKVVKGGKA